MNMPSGKNIGTAAKKVTVQHISSLLSNHYYELTDSFLEMQSYFLTRGYKLHKNIDTARIVICLSKAVHLAIVRQREQILDYDLSLNNFWFNINNIEIPPQKIVEVVQVTGIPKETVRRNIMKLVQKEFVELLSGKKYKWKLTNNRKENYFKTLEVDIAMLSKFIVRVTKVLNLNLEQKEIEYELKEKFSFYFLHFINFQLKWFKMWQSKIKDIDLIFVAIQALIPTMKFKRKNSNINKLGNENSIDNINPKHKNFNHCSINASSISDVSGIPRATCIRKLDKLVKMGTLVREMKTKRYYVNLQLSSETKHTTQKENILQTIEISSDFLSIVINALKRKKNLN